MDKSSIRKLTILLSFFLFACVAPQPIESEEADIFFSTYIERDTKIYVFDGFEMYMLNKVEEFIKEKVPTTKGTYFVLFFLKDGYFPEIKVIKGEKEDINLGKIRFKKRIDEDKGVLTGVIYKPVYGGKVFLKKGIFKLIPGNEVRVMSKKGESYLLKTDENGSFSISLTPGEYEISINGNKKKFDVVVTKAKTTIQNIQKGIMLVD